MESFLYTITWYYGLIAVIIYIIVYIIEMKLDLPTWENGEAPGISHVKLKRFIEKVINDAIRLPSFTNEPTTPGPTDDQSLPFFDPKKYQELLATAVLNKIVDSYNYEQRFDSNRDAATDCSDLDNNHNALIRRKVQSGSISSSSIEPESDCSITDPPSNISRLDDFSRRNSNSNPLADVLGQYDRNNSSRLNDYLTRHNVPLPDFSIESDSSNEDNVSAAKSIGNSWEGNWLFKKKRPGHESPAPVGMLVPCPKEDIKTQIGDKTADELSDLSEAGSDCEDNNVDEIEDTTQNALIQNKNIIGGKSPIGLFDELFEQTSLISSSSLPEGDSAYTETKNDYVLGDDLSHDLVQSSNTKQSFKAEQAINLLVDTQTLKNNLSSSKEHEKRPPTKASLEDIPKPKPRSVQKSAVYVNTREIAEEELACSSAASSAIESEGACIIANDDSPTDPTNNTNTLSADDEQSDYNISESMLKKIQCTKASAIQFLVVVSLAPSLAVPATDPESISTLAQIQSNESAGDEIQSFEDNVNGNNEVVVEKSESNEKDSDAQPDIRCIPLPEFQDSSVSTEESNLNVFIPPPVEFSSNIDDIEGAKLIDDLDKIVNPPLNLDGLHEPCLEEANTNLFTQCEDTITTNEALTVALPINLSMDQESFEEKVEAAVLTQEQLLAKGTPDEVFNKNEEPFVTAETIMQLPVESGHQKDIYAEASNESKLEIQADVIQKETDSIKDFQKLVKDSENAMSNLDVAAKTEGVSEIFFEEAFTSAKSQQSTAEFNLIETQNLEPIIFASSSVTADKIGCVKEEEVRREIETAGSNLEVHNQQSMEINVSINSIDSMISKDPLSEISKKINQSSSTEEEAKGLDNARKYHSLSCTETDLKTPEILDSNIIETAEIIFVENKDESLYGDKTETPEAFETIRSIEESFSLNTMKTEAVISPEPAEISSNSGFLPPDLKSDNINSQKKISTASQKNGPGISPSTLTMNVSASKNNSEVKLLPEGALETAVNTSERENVVSNSNNMLGLKCSVIDGTNEEEQNNKTSCCEDQIVFGSILPVDLVQQKVTSDESGSKTQGSNPSTLTTLTYLVDKQTNEKESVCQDINACSLNDLSKEEDNFSLVNSLQTLEESSIVIDAASLERTGEEKSSDRDYKSTDEIQDIRPTTQEHSSLMVSYSEEMQKDEEDKPIGEEQFVCLISEKFSTLMERKSEEQPRGVENKPTDEEGKQFSQKKYTQPPSEEEFSLVEKEDDENLGTKEYNSINEKQTVLAASDEKSSFGEKIGDEKSSDVENQPIDKEQPAQFHSKDGSTLVEKINEENLGDERDKPVCENLYAAECNSTLQEGATGEEEASLTKKIDHEKCIVSEEQSVNPISDDNSSLMESEEKIKLEEDKSKQASNSTSVKHSSLAKRNGGEMPKVEADKLINGEQVSHPSIEAHSSNDEEYPCDKNDKPVGKQSVKPVGEKNISSSEEKDEGFPQSTENKQNERKQIGEGHFSGLEYNQMDEQQQQSVYPTVQEDTSFMKKISEEKFKISEEILIHPSIEEHLTLAEGNEEEKRSDEENKLVDEKQSTYTSEKCSYLIEKSAEEKASDAKNKSIGEEQFFHPTNEEVSSLMEKIDIENPIGEEGKPACEEQYTGEGKSVQEKEPSSEEDAFFIKEVGDEKFDSGVEKPITVDQSSLLENSTLKVQPAIQNDPISDANPDYGEKRVNEVQSGDKDKPADIKERIGEEEPIDAIKATGVENSSGAEESFSEEYIVVKCESTSVEKPPAVDKTISEQKYVCQKQVVDESKSTKEEESIEEEKSVSQEMPCGGENLRIKAEVESQRTNEVEAFHKENLNSKGKAFIKELDESDDSGDLNLDLIPSNNLVATTSASMDEVEIIENVICEDLDKSPQLTKPLIERRLADFAAEVHSKLASTNMKISLEAISHALEEVFSSEVDAWEIRSSSTIVQPQLALENVAGVEEKPIEAEQPVRQGKSTYVKERSSEEQNFNDQEKPHRDQKSYHEENSYGEEKPYCEQLNNEDKLPSEEKPYRGEICFSEEAPITKDIVANKDIFTDEENSSNKATPEGNTLSEEQLISKSKSTKEEVLTDEQKCTDAKPPVDEDKPSNEEALKGKSLCEKQPSSESKPRNEEALSGEQKPVFEKQLTDNESNNETPNRKCLSEDQLNIEGNEKIFTPEQKAVCGKQPADEGRLYNEEMPQGLSFYDKQLASEGNSINVEILTSVQKPFDEKQSVGESKSSNEEMPKRKSISEEYPVRESKPTNEATIALKPDPTSAEQIVREIKSIIAEHPTNEEKSIEAGKPAQEEETFAVSQLAQNKLSTGKQNTPSEEQFTCLRETSNEEKPICTGNNMYKEKPVEIGDANTGEMPCIFDIQTELTNKEIPSDRIYPSSEVIIVEKTIDSNLIESKNHEQLCTHKDNKTAEDRVDIFAEIPNSDKREISVDAPVDSEDVLQKIHSDNLLPTPNEPQGSPELDEESPPEYMDLNDLELDDAILCKAPSFEEFRKESEEVSMSNIIQESLTTMLDDEEPHLIVDEDDNIDDDFLNSKELVSKDVRESDELLEQEEIQKDPRSILSTHGTKEEENIGQLVTSEEKEGSCVSFSTIECCGVDFKTKDAHLEHLKEHEGYSTVSATTKSPTEAGLHSQQPKVELSKIMTSNLDEDVKNYKVQNKRAAEASLDQTPINEERVSKLTSIDETTKLEPVVESINQTVCLDDGDLLPENITTDGLYSSQTVTPTASCNDRTVEILPKLSNLASNVLLEKINLKQETTDTILVRTSRPELSSENIPGETPDKLEEAANNTEKSSLIAGKSSNETDISTENNQSNSLLPLNVTGSLQSMNPSNKDVVSTVALASDKNGLIENSKISIPELSKSVDVKESAGNSADQPKMLTAPYSENDSETSADSIIDCRDTIFDTSNAPPRVASDSKEEKNLPELSKGSEIEVKPCLEPDEILQFSVSAKDEIKEEVFLSTSSEVLDPPVNIDCEAIHSTSTESQNTENLKDVKCSNVCYIGTEHIKSAAIDFQQDSSIIESEEIPLKSIEKSANEPIMKALEEVPEDNQDDEITKETTPGRGCIGIQLGGETKTPKTANQEKQPTELNIASTVEPRSLQEGTDDSSFNLQIVKESKTDKIVTTLLNLEISDSGHSARYLSQSQTSDTPEDPKTFTPGQIVVETVNVTLVNAELQPSSPDGFTEKLDKAHAEHKSEKTRKLPPLKSNKDSLIEPGNVFVEASQVKESLITQACIYEDSNYLPINFLQIAKQLPAETTDTSYKLIAESPSSFITLNKQLASGGSKTSDTNVGTEPSINCAKQVLTPDSETIKGTSDETIIDVPQSEVGTEVNVKEKEYSATVSSKEELDSQNQSNFESHITLLKDENANLELSANHGQIIDFDPESFLESVSAQAEQNELKDFCDSKDQNLCPASVEELVTTVATNFSDNKTEVSQLAEPHTESQPTGIAAVSALHSQLENSTLQISFEAINDALEQVFGSEIDGGHFAPYPCRVRPTLTPHNSVEESITDLAEESLDFNTAEDVCAEKLSIGCTKYDCEQAKSSEDLKSSGRMLPSLNSVDALKTTIENNCITEAEKPISVFSPEKSSEILYDGSNEVESSLPESVDPNLVIEVKQNLASNNSDPQGIKPGNPEGVQNNQIPKEHSQNSAKNPTIDLQTTSEMTNTKTSESSNISKSLEQNEADTFEVIPLPNLQSPVITSEELHAIIEAQRNAMRLNNESRAVVMRHVFHVSFGGATSSESSLADSLEVITESTSPDDILTEDDTQSIGAVKTDVEKTKEDIKKVADLCEADAKLKSPEISGKHTDIEKEKSSDSQEVENLTPSVVVDEAEGGCKKLEYATDSDSVFNSSIETLQSKNTGLETSEQDKKTISEANVEIPADLTSENTASGHPAHEECVELSTTLNKNDESNELVSAIGDFSVETLCKDQTHPTTSSSLKESQIIQVDNTDQTSAELANSLRDICNVTAEPNLKLVQPESLKEEFDEINVKSVSAESALGLSHLSSEDINNSIEILTTVKLNESANLSTFENEAKSETLSSSEINSACDTFQKEVVSKGQLYTSGSIYEESNINIKDIPGDQFEQDDADPNTEQTEDENIKAERLPAGYALKETEAIGPSHEDLPPHIDEPFIRRFMTVKNIANEVESNESPAENTISIKNKEYAGEIEEEAKEKGTADADIEPMPTIVVTKSSLEIPEISELQQTTKEASENPLDETQKPADNAEQTDTFQVAKSEHISEDAVPISSNAERESKSESKGLIKAKIEESNDCPLSFEAMSLTDVPCEVVKEKNSKESLANISAAQLDQNSDANITSCSTDTSKEITQDLVESIHEGHDCSDRDDNDSKEDALLTAKEVLPTTSSKHLAKENNAEQTLNDISMEESDHHHEFGEQNSLSEVQKVLTYPLEGNQVIKQQECNTTTPSPIESENEERELKTKSPDNSFIQNPALVTGFADKLEVDNSYLKVVSSSSEDISAYDTAPSSFSEISNQTSPSSLTIIDSRQDDLRLSDAGCSPCPPDAWSVYPEMKDEDLLTEGQAEPSVVDLRNKLIDELENLISSQRAFNEQIARISNYDRQVAPESDEECSERHFASSSIPFDVIISPQVLEIPEEIKVYQGKCKQTAHLLSPDTDERVFSPKIEVGEEAIVALDACDFEDDLSNDYIVSNEDSHDSLQVLEIVNTGTSGVQIEEIRESFFVNPHYNPAETIPWHAQKDDSEEAESEHTDSNESDPELSITPPEIALCYMTPHILDSIPEDLEMADSPPKVEMKIVDIIPPSSGQLEEFSCHTGEQSTYAEECPIVKSLNLDTNSENKTNLAADEYCPSDIPSPNTTQQAETHSLLSLDINPTTSDLSAITSTDPQPKDVEPSTLPTDQQTCIESSSTITPTSDDTVRTAIEYPARKVTVELTNEDVVEAHKRSEVTPTTTSPARKSYSVAMSLELTYDPTNNADSQQLPQKHGTTELIEHSLTATHAPHPCLSPSPSSEAPSDAERAANTQQHIKFNILKHAAFSKPLSDEEDAAHTGQFSHLLPGSIAEREHKKWYNAVEMPNNPYSREALKRRLSASSDKPIDIPNINSPLEKATSEDKLNRGSEDEDVTAESLVDYKRYGRDYYINHAKHASGSSKHKLTASTSLHGLNTRDDKTCDKEPTLQSRQALSSSLSSLHRSHSWGDKRSNLVAGGGSTCDIFTARPVRVEESDPILSRATKLEYLSTPDRDFYLLPSEEISSLRSISASEHSLSQAGDSLTPSEDSDTIRVYDLKKQETRLIRDDDESIGSVAAAVKGLSNSNRTTRTQSPAQTPTHARPQLTSQRSFRTTIIHRGSTPTAFKFLQPKRRLYDTRRIMSEDTSPAVREEISRTNGTTEKSVIEEDVIPALPSVKALAKVFQCSSKDTGATQATRPKSYSWKSVDVKSKEELTPASPSEKLTTEVSTPTTPIQPTSVETLPGKTNGVESPAEEPAKESYSPPYEQNYIPVEAPIVPPINSPANDTCVDNETQDKASATESVVVSEQINEPTTEVETSQASGIEKPQHQVIEESSQIQASERVEEPVSLTDSIVIVSKEEVYTPKEPSADSYSPPYDQKYNPVEPLAETESKVEAAKENVNEEKVCGSYSLEWRDDNIEIVTAPKGDQQTTPPSTPATEEPKAAEEHEKPVIEPTSLLVDITDTLKTEAAKPAHEPNVVEQFLANEKSAAMPPVTAISGAEVVSELHEEKTEAASDPASTPSIEVAAVPTENLCETVVESTPPEVEANELQSVACSGLPETEEHIKVVEHTSEQTSVGEHTQIVVQTTSVETITKKISTHVVQDASTEETTSTSAIAAIESVLASEPLTPEPVAIMEQTRDEPATESESSETIQVVASSDSISEKSSLYEEALEATSNSTNGQSAEESTPAENGINGVQEPPPTSPTQKTSTEQPQQNGSEPKRSSEIRFTQEMPPLDRPISPVLVPGKLKSSIAFFENLKNKK